MSIEHWGLVTPYGGIISLCRTASRYYIPLLSADSLVQDCSISSALAIEKPRSCTKPSMSQLIPLTITIWRLYIFKTTMHFSRFLGWLPVVFMRLSLVPITTTWLIFGMVSIPRFVYYSSITDYLILSDISQYYLDQYLCNLWPCTFWYPGSLLTLIPAWISNNIHYNVCDKIYNRWSLGLDKYVHPILGVRLLIQVFKVNPC